jgi:hypothetical protein
MRHPVPPICKIAQSGKVIAWKWAGCAGVVLLDESALSQSFNVSEVTDIAVSPSGACVALARPHSLIVLDRESGWLPVFQYDLSEPLFRMALGDDGLVVAATAHDGDNHTHIIVFEDGLILRQDLGEATAFDLLLDTARRRVLITGQRGLDSLHGGGQPFVQLVELGALGESWSSLWEGPAPMDSPNGWLMPLVFGDVGIYNAQMFVVISPDTNPGDVGKIVDQKTFEHLETVASSPNGHLVAWFWPDQDDPAVTYLCTGRLADGTVVELPSVEDLGSFPTIAIDDNSNVTLVDVLRPATIRVRRLSDGQVTVATYDIADTK